MVKVHALGPVHFKYSEMMECWEAWATCSCGDTFATKALNQPTAQQRVTAFHKDHKRMAKPTQMNILVICVGLPASGKSTYAEQVVHRDPEQAVRVNMDLLRLMLHAEWWTDSAVCNQRVARLRDQVVDDLMEIGVPMIISDDTNLHPDAVLRLSNAADQRGYDVKVVRFTDIPVEECVRRDAARERSVGEDVIRGMYERYRGQFPAS